MKSINKYRVNWIDGMKINKSHFIDLEDAVFQAVAQTEAKQVNAINYGLLPDYSDQGSAIDVHIAIDGQSTINVVLNKCMATTLSGYQINISEQTKPLLEQSGYILKKEYQVEADDTELYIVLTINPYKRVPVGESDPDEDPPRHPFVLPEYKLNVLRFNEVTDKELGAYHLTIGKVVIKDGIANVVDDFIPPCASIQSHPDLKFTFSEILMFFNHMESYAMHIIQKIHQKKQTNDLAGMVLNLSQRTLTYLNATLPEYRMKDKFEPPVVMVNKLASLARVIKSSFDVYVGTGKEELLNYLTDWCDLNQGAFENVLVDMLEIKYQHTDINASLYKISDFTKLMLSLFKKLNELDYIGKKSDSNIFVKEEVVDNVEVKTRRSFLLD